MSIQLSHTTLSYVLILYYHFVEWIVSYRFGSKAAIGYSYGDNVTESYNASDNDSDLESIHEEEGLLWSCSVYMWSWVMF